MTNTIEHVRALLADRQNSSSSSGSDTVTVCLDVRLLEQLEALEAELIVLQAQTATDEPEPAQETPRARKRRLSDPPPEPEPDPEPVDVEDAPEVVEQKTLIAAKQDEIRAVSLSLVFRAVGSTGYQAVLNRHPKRDDDSAKNAAFFDDLANICLDEVSTVAGEVLDLGWREIRPALSYGEWEQTTLRVLALNRVKVDVPFSLRSSVTTGS